MLFITSEQDLKIENKNCVVYFYASWMPCHKKMTNILSFYEKKYSDCCFLAIDVDFFKGLCKKFKINSIPNVVFLVNNKEYQRVEGLFLSSVIKNILFDIYTNKIDVIGE